MEPTPSLETFRAALLAAGVPPGPIQAAVSGGATSPTGLSAALLLSGAARAAQLEAAYARWGERAEAAGSVSARLGPYEVEELLGQGACGEVYRVRDPRTGARYAAKRLVDLGDAEERSRFAREAEVLAQLQHPHVVRIHAAELAGASPYFVLDLCPRGSLRERLERGPLEQAEARSVVSALARGLEAAHEVGVLHRDLKPDNVLFDDDGRAQLADFGLARFLTERHSRLTQTGVILGTPCYMAPEQVQDAKRADARSDAAIRPARASRRPSASSTTRRFACARSARRSPGRTIRCGWRATTLRCWRRTRPQPSAGALDFPLRRRC
ncbi:MAG: serine/threonine-protein kinase [Planctomycetota bacterium]